jgi:predicted nucleic acid-binding protein
MKAVYVESSALGRAFLHGDHEAHAALRSAARGRAAFTSELTRTELFRALNRPGIRGELDKPEVEVRIAKALRQMDLVPISGEILRRASESFPREYLGTLDAIHLATSLHLSAKDVNADLVVLTRDERVRENAVALRLKVA